MTRKMKTNVDKPNTDDINKSIQLNLVVFSFSLLQTNRKRMLHSFISHGGREGGWLVKTNVVPKTKQVIKAACQCMNILFVFVSEREREHETENRFLCIQIADVMRGRVKIPIASQQRFLLF